METVLKHLVVKFEQVFDMVITGWHEDELVTKEFK